MCAGSMHSNCLCSQGPVFASGSSKVTGGFFGLFVSFGPEFAPSPIQFHCILSLKERCVQVQTLQRCSRGPRVPACLRGWGAGYCQAGLPTQPLLMGVGRAGVQFSLMVFGYSWAFLLLKILLNCTSPNSLAEERRLF